MKTIFRVLVAIAVSLALVTPSSTSSYAGSKKAGPALMDVQPLGALEVVFPDKDVTVASQGSTTSLMTLTNTSGEDVEFQIEEIEGFKTSAKNAPGKSTVPSKWVKQNKKSPFVKVAVKGKPKAKSKRVLQHAPTGRYIPGTVGNIWDSGMSTAAFGIAYKPGDDNSTGDDNATVWVGNFTNASVHAFSTDGAPGTVIPSDGSVTSLVDLTVDWNSMTLWGVGTDSKTIHEIDQAGYTGQMITINGTNVTAQKGLAFDPNTDTFFSAGKDKIIYRFDREGNIQQQRNVSTLIPATGGITGLAFNPDTQHLFAMVPGAGTTPARIYVLNAAENFALLSKFTIEGFSAAGGAGLEIDCGGNLWAVDKVNGKVYRIESGEETGICNGPVDVPWLSENPDSGLAPGDGSPVEVEVTFNAADMGVGVYTARLRIVNTTGSETASKVQTYTIPVSMTVVETGYVTVNITGASGGRWQLDDDGVWLSSGVNKEVLANTDHTVTFKDVTGYVTPKAQVFQVAGGENKVINVKYLSTGSISCTITPQGAVTAGARWRVDGGAWMTSGQKASATVGKHTVSFKDVDGYVTPNNVSVSVVSGQTASCKGVYVPTGKLTVTITPSAAITKGAKWAVDGGQWHASGDTVTLAAGTYELNFQDATGYVTPANQSVEIAAGVTKKVAVEYKVGAKLIVTITPQNAINAGAEWQLDNGEWYRSGQTVSVSPGSHTIKFNEVDGYVKPKAQTVTVIAGATKTVKGEYTEYGSLIVKLLPLDAINKGAKWQVDGGDWYNSGKKVLLTPGSHTVTFKAVTGYITPGKLTVTITEGVGTTSTVTYKKK